MRSRTYRSTYAQLVALTDHAAPGGGPGAALLAAAAAPLLGAFGLNLLTTIFVLAIGVLGLNLLTGVAGQISLTTRASC